MNLEVSKFHAKIEWEQVFWESYFWLVDVGSRNGTFLNGVRLSESRLKSKEKEVLPFTCSFIKILTTLSLHQFAIKVGDEIRFGNTTFTVELPTPVQQDVREFVLTVSDCWLVTSEC
jgi:pSer/pThr/pTyr-binding forkhead associated (FHA) protein